MQSAIVRTISGRVVNALTGAALPRALVNLNSRAALTDAQGKFSFSDFAEAQGYLLVTKPGFSQSADASQGISHVRIPDLDALQEIRMYPDALVTGTVTGGDGLPLAHVQMRIRRLTFEMNGPRWLPVGFSQTDTHGQYRFSVPAGRYRITSEFMQRSSETGEVVLPAAFPPHANGNYGEFLELKSGENQEINFRPRTGPGSLALLKLNLEEGQRGVRFIATGSSGVPFRMQTAGRQADGVYRLELPPGTYTVRALLNDRDDLQDGTARVTVTGRGVLEVPIQLSPAAVFPVETLVQASSNGPGNAVAAPPTTRNLNLSLQNRANDGNGEEGDVQMAGRPDAPAELRVLPGRYRLAGGRFGLWTVRSATCGSTDLLRDDLVVGPGAGGSPIRIVLSNATGSLHGTVRTSGVPAFGGWLYLLPAEPSLTPAIEVMIQPDGSYRWIGAPGRYTAVASDHPIREDFRDAKFLARFGASGRAVEVTEGVDTAADLSVGTVAP